MKKIVGLLAAVLAFSVGFYFGTQRGSDRDVMDMALVHELVTLNLCVATLSLEARANEVEDPLFIIRASLNTALDESKRLHASGARIRQPAPNLVETVHRAALLYESLGDEVRRQAALTLHEQLVNEVH